MAQYINLAPRPFNPMPKFTSECACDGCNGSCPEYEEMMRERFDATIIEEWELALGEPVSNAVVCPKCLTPFEMSEVEADDGLQCMWCDHRWTHQDRP